MIIRVLVRVGVTPASRWEGRMTLFSSPVCRGVAVGDGFRECEIAGAYNN